MNILNSPFRLFLLLNLIHVILLIISYPFYGGWILLYLFIGFIPTVLVIGFFTFLYHIYLLSLQKKNALDNEITNPSTRTQENFSNNQNISTAQNYSAINQNYQLKQNVINIPQKRNHLLEIFLYGPLLIVPLMKVLKLPIESGQYMLFVLAFQVIYFITVIGYFIQSKNTGTQFVSGFIPVFKIPLLDFLLFLGLLYVEMVIAMIL